MGTTLAVGAAILESAPTIINAVEGAIEAAPDLIAQVKVLTGAHTANVDRIAALEAALFDVIGFVTHTFPTSHTLTPTTTALATAALTAVSA